MGPPRPLPPAFRPPTAFMNFFRDWRERVKAENPEVSFGEVGRLLATKWKSLDEEEKKDYLEKAAADQARYEQEKGAASAAKADYSDDENEDDE